MTDQYANTSSHIYLLLEGQYFRRTVGVGWERIAELPAGVNLFPLHPLQHEAYVPELKRVGLLG